MKVRKVLVLAPHTDDAELGCGGFISRMIEEGTEVHIAVFSIAEDSLPEGAPRDTLLYELHAAMQVLQVPEQQVRVYGYPVRRFSSFRQEVLEDLVALKRDIQPELVLLPSGNDVHQDHQVVSQEGLRAFKDTSVLGYELPWNHLSFSSQAFFSLREEHVQKKWNALQAYHSQRELRRSYFTEDFIRGLAKVRGTQVKCDWAEAFEVLRVVL